MFIIMANNISMIDQKETELPSGEAENKTAGSLGLKYFCI